MRFLCLTTLCVQCVQSAVIQIFAAPWWRSCSPSRLVKPCWSLRAAESQRRSPDDLGCHLTSGHCSVCLMAVPEVLSLQPLTSETTLHKQLIGWVSCLSLWERRLFLSVYRRSACLSFSERYSLYCLWKNNVLQLQLCSKHQALGARQDGPGPVDPLCSWKSVPFVVRCKSLVLRSLFICTSQLSSSCTQIIKLMEKFCAEMPQLRDFSDEIQVAHAHLQICQ